MSNRMLESSVESYLVHGIKSIGGICDKFSSPSNRGVPDRVVIYKARVVFVELKQQGKKPDPLQEWQHKRYKEAGAEVVTIAGKIEAAEFIRKLRGA